MRVTTPSPAPGFGGGIALSDSEKAEALADCIEAEFQPVADQSDPEVIEKVDLALRAYSYMPTSETILTDPAEVQRAIRGLKISNAPGPDGIPNWALMHLSQRMILLLVALLNAILRRQYFPLVWKHARVISILKPGKNPALPSSYRPIRLVDTIGKVF
jgi:glutamate/tyrosine decarboxylase-like PLP-dependent enzyme